MATYECKGLEITKIKEIFNIPSDLSNLNHLNP